MEGRILGKPSKKHPSEGFVRSCIYTSPSWPGLAWGTPWEVLVSTKGQAESGPGPANTGPSRRERSYSCPQASGQWRPLPMSVTGNSASARYPSEEAMSQPPTSPGSVV